MQISYQTRIARREIITISVDDIDAGFGFLFVCFFRIQQLLAGHTAASIMIFAKREKTKGTHCSLKIQQGWRKER